MTDAVAVSDEVAAALEDGRPVVALETTLVAHGFPAPDGVAVGLESERRVREAGAIPASVGVLDGEVRVGLSAAELARFDATARKVGARDLAVCAVAGDVGATTAGGTLAVCAAAGIRFLGTGGLGGVHRAYATRPDVSGDVAELTRTAAVVVCSGVKSLLDVPATVELLETVGVPVLGWRTDTLPLFYRASGGPRLSARVDDPREAARIALAHWRLGRESGLVVANPPAISADDVEPLIASALASAESEGVAGGAVTPFVLAFLHRESGGRTLEVNRRLVADNAALAAELAAEYARLV